MRQVHYIITITVLLSGLLFSQNFNQEFRATWVITWEHISASSSVDENKARVREILDNHKKANMTSVIFQARQGGTAYYNSSFEPWGHYAGSSYPGYDPLQYAIEEAHERGLELHAWFNVFNVSSTQAGTIVDKHPEWICRDQNGNPMTSYRAASPGLEAVRDYTVNVAMEIVRNYDIDGFHLDYIRWNEYDTDDMLAIPKEANEVSKLDGMFDHEKMSMLANSNSTNRFLYDVNHPFSAGIPSGFGSWEAWWRWSVTEFVKTLHDSIQAVKPWVRLSPAALGKYKDGGAGGWNGYNVVYQDAALWFNEGYVEQLTPMHYHWLTGSELYNAISSDWEPNITKGINEGRLYSVGPPSYRLADNNVWGNHVGIVNRMREKSWVDGFQFFSYGNWRGYNYWEEAGENMFNNKVKIREITIINTPNAPILTINKVDSLTYNLEITPDVTENKNQWFALYRSEDDFLDVTTDKIINISFEGSSFTVHEEFDGLQNFNGVYKYFATTLNRYWNESSISNTVTTDLIPSFAPTVIASNPHEGGQVKISESIEINFSKSMKTEYFIDYITLVPDVQISNLAWKNDNSQLIINFDNFEYNTSYQLTISSLASDVNSLQLDGNRDGISGDDFVLNFSTTSIDTIPPIVLIVNPFLGENVDVAEIVVMEFDEIIDEETLENNGIALSKDSEEILFNYLHTVALNGRSVISIQPIELLDPSSQYSLVLNENVADTSGNSLSEPIEYIFNTKSDSYIDIITIENFTSPGDWWDPSGSGSTVGVFASGTSFGYSSKIVPPSSDPKKAAKLSYLWDENSNTHLLREYLSGGTPQSIYFDTTYTLQSYVFGDGSNNSIRLCIDENNGTSWTDHEVSEWVKIDWYGWQLIEWDLGDPYSVGTWIGDEVLNGNYYRIDSYQLTKGENGSLEGSIYLDDLRAVIKKVITTDIVEENLEIPSSYRLAQNYPNPFNPTTEIEFSVPKKSFVSLIIYNLQGEKVKELYKGELSAGNYSKTFSGENLASGLYLYRLISDEVRITKKMMLLK